ncbi:MAG TPA: hypothetical protein VHU79_05960 [Sphingomicrobium sp.]|nr:hypothetical protein [Sphingomicrobium sp.]
MKRRIILVSTSLGLGLAFAASAAPAKKQVPAANPPSVRAEQLMQNCAAHKFETVVKTVVDGQPEQSKVKLCGKEGQSEAEWIGTLKDAVTKLDANQDMPEPERNQIVAALDSEIARLEIHGAATLTSPSASKTTALDGISPLPPLPQSGQFEASSRAPHETPPAIPRRDYAELPPLPTAPVAPTHVLIGGVSASTPLLPRPKMRLSCYNPGGTEGPCTGFTRYTLITVQAGEDLPPDTSLRFVRDGDPRADVQLAQVKKGRSMRFAMPGDVCRHAVGGELELRIVRAGQEVGTDGPYDLEC